MQTYPKDMSNSFGSQRLPNTPTIVTVSFGFFTWYDLVHKWIHKAAKVAKSHKQKHQESLQEYLQFADYVASGIYTDRWADQLILTRGVALFGLQYAKEVVTTPGTTPAETCSPTGLD
eukprot:3614162-Amphidinium_carterae.1